MIFPIPLFRFFSKKEYAQEMYEQGFIRFTPIHAFVSLEDEKYRDEVEQFYHIKRVHKKEIIIDGKVVATGGTMESKFRKIDNAWAFCATTSLISNAAKGYCTCIMDFGKFMRRLEEAIQLKFGERLAILFGPVVYYDPENRIEAIYEASIPPYFYKPHKFKDDLEFRIVIIPSDRIYARGSIEPITFEIKDFESIFCETILLK